METEINRTKDKEEIVRHWTDNEMKEAHHKCGYNWRSNRKRLRTIPVTDSFRNNYDSIFGHS